MLQPFLLLMLSQAATPPTAKADGPAGRQLKLDVQLDAASLHSADTNQEGALNLAEFTAEYDRRIDAMIARNSAAQRKIGPSERSKMREGIIAPDFRGSDKNSDNLLTKDEVKSFQKGTRSVMQLTSSLFLHPVGARVSRPLKPAGKELGCEEIALHGRADRIRVEAGGDGHPGRRGDPPNGRFGADVLPLKEGVRRAGRGRAAAREAARGKEPQAQATGRRPEPGQAHPAGRSGTNVWSVPVWQALIVPVARSA